MTEPTPSNASPDEDYDAGALIGELTKSSASQLKIQNHEEVEQLKQAIKEAHDNFLTDRLASSLRKSPKEQKARLAELQDHLIRAHTSFLQLPPEYAVAIGARASPEKDGKPFDIVGVPDYLARLANGIYDFLEDFEPPRGRPVDFALESSVRALLPIVERLADSPAHIRWNKNTDKQPEPRNAACAVIVHVINSFPSPPTQTAILNMIAKVQKQPERSTDDLEAILRAHSDDLGLSLKPKPNE
jgi:hypothetical protein